MTDPNTAERLLTPLAPSLWRLPLPSQTMPPFEHTNHFVVQDGGVGMLVEAGFADPQDATRIRAVLEQTGVRFLKAILLTHTHPDHVAGLKALQEVFPDIPVFVHPAELPRLEHPNLQALQDGRVLTVGNLTVTALHTPGHSPGHLSYYLEDSRTVLAGDLVAGQGSSWVGHPEGDVTDYLASLERLRSLKLRTLAPGHGEPTQDPYTKLNEARRHRMARLEQVHTALQDAPRTLAELRAIIYPDVPEALVRLTEMSLLALLKKLMNDLRVLHLGEDEAGPYAARR